MKEQLEHILKKIRHISLTEDEKAVMRGHLEEYMQFHPVRSPVPQTLPVSRREAVSLMPDRGRPMRFALAGALVIILAGGGVSYAAEGSVPGDMLYPVKVSVNEEAVHVIISDEEEAQWEARRAERRIEEAEQLAAENRMTSELRSKLEVQAIAHLQAAEDIAAALPEDEQVRVLADIQSQIESSLAAHEEALAQMEKEEEITADVRGQINALRETMRTRLAEAQQERILAEEQLTASIDAITENTAREKLSAAQKAIETALDSYERVRSRLSLQRQEGMEDDLAVLQGIVAESNAFLQSGTYAESFTKSQEVIRHATRLRVLADTRARFQIDADPIEFEEDVEETEVDVAATSTEATSTDEAEVENGESSEDQDEQVEDSNGDSTEPTSSESGTIDVEADVEGTVELEDALETGI